MPDFIALHELLAKGRPDGLPVCRTATQVVCWGEFARRVTTRLAWLKGRQASRWLLSGDDPLAFAVDLLALCHAGKRAVIPPNAQPGTLTRLAGAYDALMPEIGTIFPHAQILPAFDPQQAGIDLYTSGSTGEPKLVRKTLLQLETEAVVLEQQWGERLGDLPLLATVPHQHIYGLLFRIVWPLCSGRVFDAVTCVRPDVLEARLKQFGRAALASSPAHLSRLPQLIALPALKGLVGPIFSSGGPLAAETARDYFSALGEAPLEIFGSTETGGIAWRRREGLPEQEDWTPFPGISTQCSAEGALLIRSPYLESDDLWQTDDGIDLLPDGRFRLRGRLDRVVKIEEKRLSLPEMESALTRHPWVRAAALVVLPGKRQTLGAVVELAEDGRQALETQGRRELGRVLRQHLSQDFEAVLLPRRWRFPEQLPFNERGKLSQAALAELFADPPETTLFPQVKAEARLENTVHGVVLTLHIGAEVAHFSGHFPQMPILPGIVQLDWALRYARQYLGLNGRFVAVENLKFLGLVLPDTTLQLSLRWQENEGRLEFAFFDTQRKYASGRVLFALDE